MRVLIAGSLGQLGSDLVDVFSDHDVVAYDYEDMDITNESSVHDKISSNSPGLVINAAAYTRVDESETENIQAYKVNALGPFLLAKECSRLDIPLAHISTNYVFNGSKKDPYIEEDFTHPINAYGVTKLVGEFYVQYACEKYFIFRVAGLFGLTPSRMKGTNFVEAMLRLGAQGKPLRVVSDEYLSPTYTRDAAAIIKKITSTKHFGLYHLVNKGQCSWLEFANKIFNLADMQVQINPVTAEEYGAPAKRPKNSCLENRKLKKIGYDEMRTWQDALKDYLANR